MRNLQIIGTLAVGVTAAACGTKDAPSPLAPSGPTGRVRFVNMITDTTRGRVNAILEGVPFGVNLTYGQSTPATLPAPSTANYSAILAGNRTMLLKRTADTTTVVATVAFTVGSGQDQTVYAIGGSSGSAVTSLVIEDANPDIAIDGDSLARGQSCSHGGRSRRLRYSTQRGSRARDADVRRSRVQVGVDVCDPCTGDISDPRRSRRYCARCARRGGIRERRQCGHRGRSRANRCHRRPEHRRRATHGVRPHGSLRRCAYFTSIDTQHVSMMVRQYIGHSCASRPSSCCAHAEGRITPTLPSMRMSVPNGAESSRMRSRIRRPSSGDAIRGRPLCFDCALRRTSIG